MTETMNPPASAQPMAKIDERGNYLPFPGTTVVAAIRDADLPLWRALHAALDSLDVVKEHYALLPAESYHMTTSDLFTAREHGLARIEGELPHLREFHQALVENAYEPSIVVEGFSVRPNVCRLNLAFSEEQQAINKDVCERFGFLDRIPPVFHITLGYSFRPTSERIRDTISEAIGATLKCWGKRYVLDQPRLCYFDDMTKFIPWDARSWPWAMESSTFAAKR